MAKKKIATTGEFIMAAQAVQKFHVYRTGSSTPASSHGDYNKALRELDNDPRGGHVEDDQKRVRYRKQLDIRAMRQQVTKLRAEAYAALAETAVVISRAQETAKSLLAAAAASTKRADDIEQWAVHNGHSLE
jgi:hypothetical protein